MLVLVDPWPRLLPGMSPLRSSSPSHGAISGAHGEQYSTHTYVLHNARTSCTVPYTHTRSPILYTTASCKHSYLAHMERHALGTDIRLNTRAPGRMVPGNSIHSSWPADVRMVTSTAVSVWCCPSGTEYTIRYVRVVRGVPETKTKGMPICIPRVAIRRRDQT